LEGITGSERSGKLIGFVSSTVWVISCLRPSDHARPQCRPAHLRVAVAFNGVQHHWEYKPAGGAHRRPGRASVRGVETFPKKCVRAPSCLPTRYVRTELASVDPTQCSVSMWAKGREHSPSLITFFRRSLPHPHIVPGRIPACAPESYRCPSFNARASARCCCASKSRAGAVGRAGAELQRRGVCRRAGYMSRPGGRASASRAGFWEACVDTRVCQACVDAASWRLRRSTTRTIRFCLDDLVRGRARTPL
jgi:hypothetical protein